MDMEEEFLDWEGPDRVMEVLGTDLVWGYF